MVNLLGAFLILALIIIFIISIEFRNFKKKVEDVEDREKNDNQRYRDEVDDGNKRFEKSKNRINGLVKIIEPRSNILSADDFGNYNKDYHIQNFQLATVYIQYLAEVCELATNKLNSLSSENDILKAEVKALRLLDGLGEIKSRVEISKELEKIVSILRSKDKQMDVELPRIYDLADKIDRENADLNRATEALEEITRSLGDIDDLMKDENIGHVDKKWQDFLSSSKPILIDVLTSMNLSYEKKEHIEVSEALAKIQPMLDQINLISVEFRARLDMSKLASASAAGGGLVL